MKTKIYLVIMFVLFLSGCVDPIIVPNMLTDGKYISDKHSIEFKANHVFFSNEYSKFTQKTTTYKGTYQLDNVSLTLDYASINFVRRFIVSNNSHTITETDEGKMVYEWAKP
jgi:polyisoprenoid-binding protein YceI